MKAVERRFPGVLVQWEDFAQANAIRLLERYRNELCTFNDDIQGTAAVVAGTLPAAVAASAAALRPEDRDSGSGLGGLRNRRTARCRDDRRRPTGRRGACTSFSLRSPGALARRATGLRPFQRGLAQKRDRVDGWRPAEGLPVGLLEVIANAHPTILIGVSGQPGIFTEEIIRAMAARVERPIIFPLSNPNSARRGHTGRLDRLDRRPGAGGHGEPVRGSQIPGRSYSITQCNNSYIFPGLGLGVRACGATRVSNGMFMAAARALAACSPARATRRARSCPHCRNLVGLPGP